MVMGMYSHWGPVPDAELDINIPVFREEYVRMEKPPVRMATIDPFFVKSVPTVEMLDDGPP